MMTVLPQLDTLGVLEETVVLMYISPMIAHSRAERRAMAHLAASSLICDTQFCKNNNGSKVIRIMCTIDVFISSIKSRFIGPCLVTD